VEIQCITKHKQVPTSFKNFIFLNEGYYESTIFCQIRYPRSHSHPIRYADRRWGPTGLSNVTILLNKHSFKIPGIKASCKARVIHFAGCALCSQFMRDSPNEAHAPRTTIKQWRLSLIEYFKFKIRITSLATSRRYVALKVLFCKHLLPHFLIRLFYHWKTGQWAHNVIFKISQRFICTLQWP
jgi:hypothetical protein